MLIIRALIIVMRNNYDIHDVKIRFAYGRRYAHPNYLTFPLSKLPVIAIIRMTSSALTSIAARHAGFRYVNKL